MLSVAGIGLLGGSSSFAQPTIRVSNAKDPLAIKKQVVWYLDHFDITEDVFISVIFDGRMPDKMGGMTCCLNSAKPQPRLSVKLRIDARLSKKEQRLVLAHEMVHVKQYVKGELKVLSSKKVM